MFEHQQFEVLLGILLGLFFVLGFKLRAVLLLGRCSIPALDLLPFLVSLFSNRVLVFMSR
jgi:hypothetical protein